MENQKSRPAHGLSELITEIGVIVLGVLIALAAEQGVERLNWDRQVDGARTAMREELHDAARDAQLRVVIARCQQEGSDRLAGVLAGVSAPPKAQAGDKRAYAAPLGGWKSAAWQAAIASGATSHMASDDVLTFAEAYAAVGEMATLNRAELEDDAELAMLGGRAELSATRRDQLVSTLARSRAANDLMVLRAKAYLEQSARLGVALTPTERDKVLENARRVVGDCADPYPPPPPKPTETKAPDTKPADAKPADRNPADATPIGPKPADAKAAPAKPAAKP